ncbi:putative endo-1,3(4)-beta-glucanase [Lachnellula suecica]|uniref:Putative endo-1,3(4)-beta-glucanase n=1 Tax=Lachnellula suecica TaxID=602035 RepID=A0A8T9C8Y2_9HELO|nr:putative endo-1,3(4)-beta-glucanase [Lachnellula suecica]
MHSQITAFTICTFIFSCSLTSAYTLVHNYDYTNWYTSFAFQNLPDPTQGTVEYIALAEAQSSGLTRIIGNQVFMGVDNTTFIPATSSAGRKSIWIESNDEFLHGLLIGDFAHIPGSDCGSWPGFWTIRNGQGTYGEIDILESFSDNTIAFSTLHTAGQCTFNAPSSTQLGTPNEDDYDCNLSTPGCSVKGPAGSYGDPFNAGGGGVYAMQWTSDFIKIFFFPRSAIPADIIAGNPDPTQWGLPTANFDTAFGDCDIDACFPPQTIYFDTTFCGGNAGGASWTSWTDCSSKTGLSTCEEYVRTQPGAFDEAYWLVNSVKVYQ